MFGSAKADNIVLKNGNVLEGEVISVANGKVEVLWEGQSVTFRQHEVIKIVPSGVYGSKHNRAGRIQGLRSNIDEWKRQFKILKYKMRQKIDRWSQPVHPKKSDMY